MPRQTPRFSMPSLSFLETDADTILKEFIELYETTTSRTLADGDPVRLFINTLVVHELELRNAFNLGARNNLLTYAEGDYLDALGNYVNTPRIEASNASATIRFTLNAAVSDSVYQIPQGTLVTDGSYQFATDELATVEVGSQSVDVTATAQTAGSALNGIAIGSINQMVDPLPNIESVSNIDVSSGGADLEDDDTYADRIRLAPASFSVAGPHDSYVYHALKFSGSIIDVSVYGLTDHPGNVYIHPLLTDGEIPGDAFLTQLKAYLSGDTIRPLTDNVLVSAPEAVDYTIDLAWYLKTEDTESTKQITSAVAAAVEEYRLWQQAQIGRDITPDHLIRLVMEAGAKRLTVASPAFTELTQSQVAQCKATDVTISFGGVEDE